MALARASAVTTTLKLGTGITLVRARHPLLLAKEVATLDYFSRDRFSLASGPAGTKKRRKFWGQFRPPLDADARGH